MATPSSSTVESRTDDDDDEFIDEYHAKDEAIVSHCELCTLVDQRCFYIHHSSLSSHWEPPWARWRCRLGLPYAWEQAVDAEGRCYYIDHINEKTSYADPRSPKVASGIRKVRLTRDALVGYGFVAAGQQPVVVQFVSPGEGPAKGKKGGERAGGPSDGLLFPNDRIVSVDGNNVENESKDSVVSLVRSAEKSICLDVEQVSLTSTGPRRACRVRFTDKISVSSPDSPLIPFPSSSIPNVLRVFLENGQTRSFKYDASTTVQEVCTILCDKLQLRLRLHFVLALEYSIGSRSSKMTLLERQTTLHELASSRTSSHTRCVFRFAFIPSDAYSLYLEDPRSFEYFYVQCVNDVVCGRFAFEMRYEACIRLAALHMQQVSMDAALLKEGRVSISKIEKELGLATFLPTILLENVKMKEIRKHIRFYLKKDRGGREEGTTANCTRPLCNGNRMEEPSASSIGSPSLDSSILLRLKYIQILTHLPSFGCRSFSVTFQDSQVDMLMQVDPRCGIVVRHVGKSLSGGGHPVISIPFQLLSRLSIQEDSDTLSLLVLRLNSHSHHGLHFIVERSELAELIVFLQGYHSILVGRALPCDYSKCTLDESSLIHPPAYASIHTVVPSGWNYSSDASPGEKTVDFRERPPPYEIASTFVQSDATSPALDHGLSPLPEERSECSTPVPPPLSSLSTLEKPRTLLKATDSLLIKKIRVLHGDHVGLLSRLHSNGLPSDSSDTEDSSWSDSLLTDAAPLSVGTDASCVSFGLSSPDALPSSSLLQSLHTIDSLLHLFPDFICTDNDIIDLTTPVEGQPSRFGENGDEEDEGGKRVRFVFPSPPGGVSQNGRGVRRSETFPLPQRRDEKSTMRPDEIADFLERSNSVKGGDDESHNVPSATVRRVSLKEFTGLESAMGGRRDFALAPWRDSSPHSSLLSSFSARRRSLFSSDRPSPMGPPPTSFIEEHEETTDVEAFTARLEALRLSFREGRGDNGGEEEGTITQGEEAKLALLEASRKLSTACKILIRESSSSGRVPPSLTEPVAEEASVVVSASHLVLSHIKSVYRAELVSARVDQMLSSLCSLLPSLSTAPSQESLRLSTSLAASLSQLIQTVASL